MSISIRRCSSCLRDDTTTWGFAIEIEILGHLVELIFTRTRGGAR